MKGGGILTPGPGHHGNPAPVILDKSESPGSDPVHRENFETPVLIQGVIRLLEVQKYLVEDHLPNERELLYQLGLEGGGLRPTATQNAWRTSWNWITEVNQRFRSPVKVLQRTYTRTNPQNSPPPSFGIRTTFCQVLLSESVPLWNATCTMANTPSQWVASGSFSCIAY